MTLTSPLRPLLLALVLGLLPWSAGAVVKLELSPPSYKFGDLEGGGTAQAAFDVLITGLTDGIAVAGYDLGLIYDPSIMKLASFGGFTTLLGNPDDGEVYNADYLEYYPGPPEQGTSLWDYRADHPTLGSYTGPVLGTPDITPGGEINEGSLRFTQISILDRTALLGLQQPDQNHTLILFSLIFDVDTTEQNHKRSTPLRFVDDRDYAGFPGTAALLDFKFSTVDDPDASVANYPDREHAVVAVPLPATLWLLLIGILGLGAVRCRNRCPA